MLMDVVGDIDGIEKNQDIPFSIKYLLWYSYRNVSDICFGYDLRLELNKAPMIIFRYNNNAIWYYGENQA